MAADRGCVSGRAANKSWQNIYQHNNTNPALRISCVRRPCDPSGLLATVLVNQLDLQKHFEPVLQPHQGMFGTPAYIWPSILTPLSSEAQETCYSHCSGSAPRLVWTQQLKFHPCQALAYFYKLTTSTVIFRSDSDSECRAAPEQ